MTSFRLAAIAALATTSLLVTATGGEAQREDTYKATLSCKEKHTDGGGGARAAQGMDFFLLRVLVIQQLFGGGHGNAARTEPADNVKVITKVKDLTTDDGNNVLDAKETDRTNDNGVAKTRHEFNNFGNYRAKAIVKVDGDTVATDVVKVGVSDRVDGKCGPPIQSSG